MTDESPESGLDDNSDTELSRQIAELEMTDWVAKLRSLRPNAAGIDAFELGFAAAVSIAERNSTDSFKVATRSKEQRAVPSRFWSPTRTALCSAFVSAVLTWLVVSPPRAEPIGSSVPMQEHAPIAVVAVDQPSAIGPTIESSSPIEQLMASPWRASALVIERSAGSSVQTSVHQRLPDTDPDLLRYVTQRRQWLTSLQNAN